MDTLTYMPLLSGFISGVIASGHCVIMCGGIALWSAQSGFGILPHLFRIFLYTVLALFAYFLFEPSQFLPQWVLGFGLIASGLASYLTRQRKCTGCAKKRIPTYSKFTRYGLWFWGILPCPMVFVSLANSTLFPSAFDATVFMLSFGLGTMPALLAFAYGSKWLIVKFTKRRLWFEIILIVLGLWTIFFGLSAHHEGEHHMHHQQEHVHSH